MSTQLRLGTPHGRGTLLAAILASGMAFLDGTVVNVALPHIGADLNAELSGLQWTINAYTLTLAAFVLLGGALGDRLGRRRIFLTGVVWFTLASVACGFAQNIGWLIGARAAQGIGAALLVPGSLAIIEASFARADRARAIGAWSGLSGVATALGPFVGGYLIDAWSWRGVFFINVPLALVVLLATLRWVPESRGGRAAERFDILGAGLGALGLAGITYAFIQAAEQGVGAVSVIVSAVVGVGAFVVFALVERRLGDNAMLPPTIFSSKRFTVLNVYTLAVYAALSGVSFFLVVFLQEVIGFSALVAGVALLPVTVLLLVGSERSGALAQRIGPKWQLVAGPLVAAVGLLLLRRIAPGANYWVDVLPGGVLFGLGLALLVAPLTAAVLGAVSDEHAGVASGVNNAAARAAGLLAVAALPLLVGLSGEEYRQPAPLTAAYRSSLLWCTGLLVAGALIALATVRHDVGISEPDQAT